MLFVFCFGAARGVDWVGWRLGALWCGPGLGLKASERPQD